MVDALGIPAALGSDATARTRCEHCGQLIDVSFAAGTPTRRSSIVSWYPHAVGAHMRRNFCYVANAFCNSGHLAAWRIAHANPAGEDLTLDQVTARGRAIWGLDIHCC